MKSGAIKSEQVSASETKFPPPPPSPNLLSSFSWSHADVYPVDSHAAAVPSSRQRLVFGWSVAPCACFRLFPSDVNFHAFFVDLTFRGTIFGTIWKHFGNLWEAFRIIRNSLITLASVSGNILTDGSATMINSAML